MYIIIKRNRYEHYERIEKSLAKRKNHEDYDKMNKRLKVKPLPPDKTQTVEDLRKTVKEKNVKGCGKMKKSELINILHPVNLNLNETRSLLK